MSFTIENSSQKHGVDNEITKIVYTERVESEIKESFVLWKSCL